jgi:hypothetical protein
VNLALRRSFALSALLVPVLLGVVVACAASTPTPRVLDEAEAVAESPAAKESSELAPQAHANAENLRKAADAAKAQGDFSGAQILGEHSLAAYEHAFVLSRYVKAEQRMVQAEAARSKVKQQLTELEEQQQRLSAEADGLELRIKVTLDKEPLEKMPQASPERQLARQQAARALASEARLLCLATELLAPQQATLEKARESLAKLELELSQGSKKDDLFPRATTARSACLTELTLARRPGTAKAPDAGLTDRLLVELTETQKLFAFRDDRGVVVSLRGVVDGQGTPTSEGAALLALLGRTAKAHPDFPLLVVVHTAGSGTSKDKSQDKNAAVIASGVVSSLQKAGAAVVRSDIAGSAQPVADARLPGAAERNARVEVVFVSPAR